MDKKEVLEFLINGFKEQFEELGKEIGVDGHSAEVADVRLDTGVALLSLIEKMEEIEKDNKALKAAEIKVDTSKAINGYIDGETQSLTIKEEQGYKNMSDYGKCIVELIDNIVTLKASGYTNTLLVDMLEEHIENDSVKYDVKEINEVFKNETGYFEG